MRLPEGGYELEIDGLAIMDIPECSEERAISVYTDWLVNGEDRSVTIIHPHTKMATRRPPYIATYLLVSIFCAAK